jgi:glucose-6-phosphate dehydrogenase assembly protein OpcA
MTTTVPLPPQFGVVLPIRAVERELNGLLRVATEVSGMPLCQVHMSNLVIYCDQMDTAERVAKQVPDIVAVHPARVLLLIRDDTSSATEITAAVSVPFRMLDRGQEACSEQIALHAPGGLADRLPFLVRRFLIGDLPTNLWWSSIVPPPMAGPMLYELAEHAQQIIYDSRGWTDPARAVAATAAWLEEIHRRDTVRWRVASDLNWRRLKYWRRLAAQAVDEVTSRGGVGTVTDLTVEHGPHAVVQGCALTAWLAQRLRWSLVSGVVRSGIEIAWRFRTPKGEGTVHVKRLPEGPPELTRMRFACTLDGKPMVMNLAAEDESHLAITLEGTDAAARTVTVPLLTSADLIGRQLSDREPDPAFRETMAVAQAMARAVVK